MTKSLKPPETTPALTKSKGKRETDAQRPERDLSSIIKIATD